MPIPNFLQLGIVILMWGSTIPCVYYLVQLNIANINDRLGDVNSAWIDLRRLIHT